MLTTHLNNRWFSGCKVSTSVANRAPSTARLAIWLCRLLRLWCNHTYTVLTATTATTAQMTSLRLLITSVNWLIYFTGEMWLSKYRVYLAIPQRTGWKFSYSYSHSKLDGSTGP